MAFSLLAGLLFAASATPAAFAASPHVRATAVTSSCASCHDVHAAGGIALSSAQKPSNTITESCFACHDGSDSETSNVATGVVDSFALGSGHAIADTSPGNVKITGCETCHNVHGASSSTRRIPAKKVNGVEVSSAGKDLCLACHSSSDDWFGPDYPSTSQPTRDATGYPVAGTWTGPVTYESTANAHRLIPESTQTVGVSEPVRREQGDCRYCHGAHGGANDYDGLVTTYTVPAQATLASDTAEGSYAAVCFTCHGGEKPSGFATAPVDIKQFATSGAGNGGHSIVTSGGTLPVGSPLPCFECHNPHGSSRGNSALLSDERGESLTTNSAASVRAFCFTCHTTSDTTKGWDSTTSTYTPIPAAEKVVGLSRAGGVLRLPSIAAHVEADLTSCYTCHGDSYAVGGANVHGPAKGQIPNFGNDLASVADGGTVTSSTTDATSGVEATGSLEASLPVLVSPPTTETTTPPVLPGLPDLTDPATSSPTPSDPATEPL